MSKHRILIVEDESIVALDIQSVLERAGYIVVGIASSGEEVIASFGNYDPDIILMDIYLQGEMTGIDTADYIKSYHHCPVIMLTAFSDAKTMEQAKTVDPFGYVLKPFNERDLLAAIEMAAFRYRLEQELIESEEKYHSLFEDDPSANFILTADGRIKECNQAFLNLVHESDREKILTDGSIFQYLEPKKFQELLMKLKTCAKLEMEELVLEIEGKEKVFLITNLVGRYDRKNQLQEIWAYCLDMTGQKQLEKEFHHAQKMETLGRLSAGIAHDFNNVLTIINGYIELSRHRQSDSGDLSLEIKGIEKAATRAGRLSRQLLALTKKGSSQSAIHEIISVINDLCSLTNRILPKNITLKTAFSSTGLYIDIDLVNLEQILINLIVNAKEALLKVGGEISVKAESVHFKRSKKMDVGQVFPGEYIVCTVADNGPGISSGIRDLVFSPFFSTKLLDKGTGLGLSTVARLVEQNKGAITLESEEGEGARFSFYFPRMQAPDSENIDSSGQVHQASRSGVIIYIEEDLHLQYIIKSLLQQRGYQVRTTHSPGEVLLELEAGNSDIADLIIMPEVMRPFRGTEISRRLQKLNSEVKILLLGGDLSDSNPGDQSQLSFLPDSFQLDDLFNTVDRLLAPAREVASF